MGLGGAVVLWVKFASKPLWISASSYQFLRLMWDLTLNQADSSSSERFVGTWQSHPKSPPP